MPPNTFVSRFVRATFTCAIATAFVVITAQTATSGTRTTRGMAGVKDFGKSKASQRNQGPKSKSYHDRGKTESQRRRETVEGLIDDLTFQQSHQSGGYCMYGLDGNLIHAPSGRICAQTEAENEAGTAKLDTTPSTINSIGQDLGKCVKGDCKNGKGLYAWSDGTKYKGEFKEQRQHGRGLMLMPSGSKYSGDWQSGVRWGRGISMTAEGLKSTDDWYQGQIVKEDRKSNGKNAYSSASRRKARKAIIRWPSLRAPAEPVGGGKKDAAVVIGIGAYAHVAEVQNADDNANNWYRYLVDARGIPAENVTLLIDEDATREEMHAATMDAAEQVKKGGSLWFVFIGHGAPSKDGNDGLLIGYDAQQKARSLPARSFARSEALEILESSSAKNINIFLDACFSGKDSSGEQLVAGLQPLSVTTDNVSDDKRTMLMTAAHSNEFAGPLPGGNRPAFSYFALGGLRGWADANDNGKVTAQELHDYTSRAMKMMVKDRKQRPTFAGKGKSELARSGDEAGPDLSKLVSKASGKRRGPSRHPAAPR